MSHTPSFQACTVLCLWSVPPALREHLQQQLSAYPITWLFPDPAEEANYLRLAPQADALVGWRPSAEVLEAARHCRLFINPGAGVQHLQERFASLPSERHPVIVNGHGNAGFTAEHIMAMLLALTQQLLPHDRWMREGKWRTGDKEARSLPLARRHVGLLGYGHVNQIVHRLLKPFGPAVSVLRRQPEQESLPGTQAVYGPEQLTEFLTRIDTLIVAIPFTPATRHMVDRKALECLGPHGILINAGRGEVVQEEALFEALKTGTIGQAGIDVWYQYQPEPDADGLLRPYSFPFHNLENVLLSPHRAASPFDDLDRWQDVIDNLERLVCGREDFLNRVDLAAGY